MAARTYSFEPPRWRPVSRLLNYTMGALAAAVIWAALYAWLGYRLWQQGASLREPLSLSLVAVLVAGAVILLLVWRELARRWLSQVRPSAWRSLSLHQMMELSPSQFEEYVARRLFERQGYRAVNTPNIKDGGVDVVLTDGEGRRAVVQCKRYRGAVGEEIVRDLYGTMLHAGADRAFLVTTGSITQAARRWAEGKPIELIDGERLIRLARSTPES